MLGIIEVTDSVVFLALFFPLSLSLFWTARFKLTLVGVFGFFYVFQ